MAFPQVPVLWQKVSYPSLKPLSTYITDLLERLRSLQDWYENGVPAVHWVSGFFFAQSFLTAAMQNYARKHRYAIDTLGFDYFVVDGEPNQAPREGVYVKGLFLEGCSWDPAPIMWLKPVLQSDIREFNHYYCPVYRTIERRGVLATTGHSTNFLMYLKMPSKEPADHWIRRGVAMLCSLSD